MSKETLLIVEDNQVLQEGLRDILISDGYTVLTADNGLAALDKMRIVSPDLVLSDISMPQMDGIAFFRAVRARPEWIAIPFIFLTARGEKEDVLLGKNLGAEDYLIKPLTREELLTAVRGRLARSHQLHVAQLQLAYETSLTVLANAIDVRDVYTRGHVERVTEYSLVLAAGLGWQGRILDQLRFGAILHDIGKIIVRESTLFKQGPLTPEEWTEIKRHPITGAEMVKDISFLAPAMPIIRHHHERWDGEGYPDRLAGEAIPLPARLVAVADGFDAMTTHRPYHGALSLDEAFQEIIANSGKQYDPHITATFEKAWLAGRIQPIRAAWEAANTHRR
ncbi:MAG: response regulator [Chloroflexi bacterium]|nr:response regulator [Chloroflexota bacterium]